jgi:hypothetical protein
MLFQSHNGGIGIPLIETFPELGANGCASCQRNGVSLSGLGAGNVVQLQSQIPGANMGRFGGLGLDPVIAAAVSVQRAINVAARALNIPPGSEGGNINEATRVLAKRVALAGMKLPVSSTTAAILQTVANAPDSDVLDAMAEQNGPAIISAFAAVATLAIDEVRNRPPGMSTGAKVAIGLGIAAGLGALVMIARR